MLANMFLSKARAISWARKLLLYPSEDVNRNAMFKLRSKGRRKFWIGRMGEKQKGGPYRIGWVSSISRRPPSPPNLFHLYKDETESNNPSPKMSSSAALLRTNLKNGSKIDTAELLRKHLLWECIMHGSMEVSQSPRTQFVSSIKLADQESTGPSIYQRSCSVLRQSS